MNREDPLNPGTRVNCARRGGLTIEGKVVRDDGGPTLVVEVPTGDGRSERRTVSRHYVSERRAVS